MRLSTRPLTLSSLAALLASAPALAAPPNPAFCYQLFNEYNKCNHQQQRHGGWGGGQQWNGGPEWGAHGGYHDGGWGDHDDGPYGHPRWRGRPHGQQADCSRWLVAMSLNRCTE